MHFTHAEAEALIPAVERAIRDAIALKQFYIEAEQVLTDERQRIQFSGGAMVDSTRVAAEKSRRDRCAIELKNAVERILAHGCEVKDLDIGLIDFRTFYHGEEVYLCWKLGEVGITYWHGLSEGFRGRRMIDEEFLQNHSKGKVS